MRKRNYILLVIVLVAFTGLGVYSLRDSNIKLQQHNIKLKDTVIELNKLELEKQQLNQKYEDAVKNGGSSDEQIKQLQKEKQDLEEKYRQLELSKAKTKEKSIANSGITPTVSAATLDNEGIAWNFLISNGFTRNQTAGIMGNLQQEHNFNTSDVAGGLGIAQWLGGRRANLMARADYTNISVQLQFLLDELNGPENGAMVAIKASGSVEGATVAFQNKFERCGLCAEGTRIKYAYDILGRH